MKTNKNRKLDSEKTYKSGDCFTISGRRAMLCQIGHNEMALIDLKMGNRYRDLVKVNDPDKVTQDELRKMSKHIRFD